uniref:Homeodomain-like protein n=1 Tax=Tanacetum cinerariifolium TaxID=118510 RepID=A0A699HHT2_TANCI|nr:homeodomain-like protein [Tanacetum cinerariifolium]
MTDAILRDMLKDVDDDNYLVIVVDEAHVIFKLKLQVVRVVYTRYLLGNRFSGEILGELVNITNLTYLSQFILNASKYMSILDHNTYLKKCIKDEDEAYTHGNGSANEHDNLVVAQHATQYNYGTHRTENEMDKTRYITLI